jgi:nitroreductase
MAEAETTRQRIAFLRGLRSIREFRPDPVPQEVLDDVLEVARWSGSAKNAQPWEFVVIHDRAMLAALARLEGSTARHLAGAAVGIVLVMEGAPTHVAQETFDEGRLSERMLLAAAAHGVGGCVGWWAGPAPAAAKQLLGIPAGRLVRTVLSLGYPDRETPRGRPRPAQARKPLTALVHNERYG